MLSHPDLNTNPLLRLIGGKCLFAIIKQLARYSQMKMELRFRDNWGVVDTDRDAEFDTEKARERLEALGDAVCIAVGAIVAWAWLIIL